MNSLTTNSYYWFNNLISIFNKSLVNKEQLIYWL